MKTMELSKQFLKEVFASYLETAFSQMLPSIIQYAIKNNDLLVGQDFASIEEAARRYVRFSRICKNLSIFRFVHTMPTILGKRPIAAMLSLNQTLVGIMLDKGLV